MQLKTENCKSTRCVVAILLCVVVLPVNKLTSLECGVFRCAKQKNITNNPYTISKTGHQRVSTGPKNISSRNKNCFNADCG